MIAFICLFIPPFIFVLAREKLADKPHEWYKTIAAYTISVLTLNALMLFLLYFVFDSKKEVFYKLNQYNDFALKYICLSVFLSLLGAYAEKFIREKVEIEIVKPVPIWRFQHWRLVVGLYGGIIFLMNFIRIFDNNFWGDEAFTINLIQNHNIAEIISITAKDVHPPLYYLILKGMITVFGPSEWIYHGISLIPYVVILIFAITLVWNKFGWEVSVLLITMAGLSVNAIRFNVEVRMYSWGALFLLLSFYEVYNILEREKNRDYILFVIFSLAAAYTHYYCLISAAFFYAGILLLAVLGKRLNIKKIFIVCAGTAIGYLPWFSIMYHSMVSRVSNFWITDIPSFKDSMKYMFSSRFGGYIFLAAAFIIVAFYETKIVEIQKKSMGKFKIMLSLKNINCSNILLLIIIGISSITGTVAFGILISHIIRPFYVLRYIYPVSAIAWLVMGIIISRLKGKSTYTVILLIYLWAIFFPAYQKTYVNEKQANEKLRQTLEATVNEIENGDMILTDVEHMNWTIAEYYYPKIQSMDISFSAIPELDQTICYWLIVSEEGNQRIDSIYSQLSKQGFSCELIVNNGILGTHPVYIYRTCKIT